MKKLIKMLIIATMLIAAIGCLASCSDEYTQFTPAEVDGFAVKVRYEVNGGVFAGNEGIISLTDVYKANGTKNEEGMTEIKLVAPGDEIIRGNPSYPVSRTDYMLIGWYAKRELRVDENGNPLDEYGELTSVSGRPQGYVYSDKWDFKNDRLVVDPNKDYSDDTPYLTLYAAWAPAITYRVLDENGNVLGEFKKSELQLPYWNAEGKMSYADEDLLKLKETLNKTFISYSVTADFEEEITATDKAGKFPTPIDYETGTVKNGGVVNVYTKWRDGDWRYVTSPDQLVYEEEKTINFILGSDLDFTSTKWNAKFSENEFNGSIEGNGYTIKNVKITQQTERYFGLFGRLGANASISNVNFENIEVIIGGGATGEANYGVLAGRASSEATLDNVTVSGALKLGKKLMQNRNYKIGLVIGGYSFIDIDFSNVEFSNNSSFPATVDDTGVVEFGR